MVKKIGISFIAVMLVVVLAIPALAAENDRYSYSGVELPDVSSVVANHPEYKYYYVRLNSGESNRPEIMFLNSILTDNGSSFDVGSGSAILYKLSDDGQSWQTFSSGGSFQWRTSHSNLLYSNADVKYRDGTSVVFALPTLVLALTEYGDFNGVFDALAEQISVSTVVEVLVVLAGACVGLAFMWWGVKKLSRALMSAWKKGRVSL